MGIQGGIRIAALFSVLFGISPEASALPLLEHDMARFNAAEVVPVVVFGKNSRRSVDEYAADQKLDAPELRREFTASGLVECGIAHGAGQLTLTGDVVTTAAHVLFDERGNPRAKTCIFSIEVDGKPVNVPLNLSTIVAGSTNPYALPAVHDWAVVRLSKPIEGVTPFTLADSVHPNMPVEFVARGHIDWGEGRRLSMEKCEFHDQLSVSQEGTREFSFDCETGDGASGGAVVMEPNKPVIGAILVGWRSNKPFHTAPFSTTHYNFAVTIEGAFKKAVIAAANHEPTPVAKSSNKAVVAK